MCEQSLFASFRHRHLPPPQALLARQAQVPQARQVQLPPSVAQVFLLLRCLEFTWWNRNEAVSSCWFLVVNGSNVRRGCAVISTALQPMSCCTILGLQGNGMSHDSFFLTPLLISACAWIFIAWSMNHVHSATDSLRSDIDIFHHLKHVKHAYLQQWHKYLYFSGVWNSHGETGMKQVQLLVFGGKWK